MFSQLPTYVSVQSLEYRKYNPLYEVTFDSRSPNDKPTPNEPLIVWRRLDYRKYHPLYVATFDNRPDIMKLLIEYKVIYPEVS